MFLLSVSLSLMASWQLTSVTYLSHVSRVTCPATPLVTPLKVCFLCHVLSRIMWPSWSQDSSLCPF